MDILYLNKIIKDVELLNCKYKSIEYEITKEDMDLLVENQDFELTNKYYRLIKDNVVDLLVDSIFGNHIVIGGTTKDGKYILTQYIVLQGLDS